MVLYARKEIAITYSDEKAIAKDLEKREILTSLHATYDAKNRVGLPRKLDMPFENGYAVLMKAYDKAYGETPEKVYEECMGLIKDVLDEGTAVAMEDYCKSIKTNMVKLRVCRQKINENLKEQNDKPDKA